MAHAEKCPLCAGTGKLLMGNGADAAQSVRLKDKTWRLEQMCHTRYEEGHEVIVCGDALGIEEELLDMLLTIKGGV